MSLEVSVTDNIDEVAKSLSDVQRKILPKAMKRAANFATKGIRTEGGREVRKIYNIKLRAVRAASKIIRAVVRQRGISAGVLFSGRPISLSDFSARAVNPWNVPGRPHRRKGGGVSVKIKRQGARELRAGAFLARTKTGKLAVFERTGEARNKLKMLHSISIPDAVVARIVRDALLKVGGVRFEKELLRQVDLLLAKEQFR